MSLDRLAGANLGVEKTHHSSEAGAFYREGKIDELKEYCVNDVKLTRARRPVSKTKFSFGAE